MESQKRILAAEGYQELGMFEDGLEELDALRDGDEVESVEAVVVRMRCLMGLKRWAEGASAARRGVVEHSGCLELFLWGAYCIRRAQSLEEAYSFMQSGFPAAQQENGPALPLYWFNLGCYHCQLGNPQDALDCVGFAIEAQPGYRRIALQDKDLKPLWKTIAMEWPDEDELEDELDLEELEDLAGEEGHDVPF